MNNELVYEKEIVPNVSTHAVKAIRERIDDVCLVKRMLKILTLHPFNTECIQTFTFYKHIN